MNTADLTGRDGRRALLTWRPSPRLVRQVSLWTAVVLGVIVLTGGAVRLSGSGLGCPTWPRCTGDSLTAGHGLRHAIELGNRILGICVFLGVLFTGLLAVRVRPVRADLRRLAAGLVIGYLGQGVLGGITVLTRLNPLAVGAHFLLSMVLVWVAIVLYRRAGVVLTDPVPVVGRELRILGRLLTATAALVLVIGTLVTGSGPHAGARVDNRLPFPLRDITQLHSDVVLFLVGATAVTLVTLRVTGAPAQLQRRGHLLLAVMLGQTVVGFTQYFTGLPAGLVAVHIAGATLLWAVCLVFTLDMWTRPMLPELLPAPQPARAEPALSTTG